MADMWIEKDGELEVEFGGITSGGNVIFRDKDGTGLWVDPENGKVDFEFGGITAGGRVNITNNQLNTQTKTRTSTSSNSIDYLLQGNPSAQRIDAITNASLNDFDSARYINGFTHAEKAILYRERAKRTKKSSNWDILKFVLIVCTCGLIGGGDGMLAGASTHESSSLSRKFSKIKASTILTEHARKEERRKKS